jgi:hypothetical protein
LNHSEKQQHFLRIYISGTSADFTCSSSGEEVEKISWAIRGQPSWISNYINSSKRYMTSSGPLEEQLL